MKLVNHSEIFSPEKLVEYSEKGIVSKQLTMNPSGNITLFAIDKGQTISEHKAPFNAVIQIMEGEAEVIIDSNSYLLKAGEMIIMPANVPHALNAPEAFKMMLIMIRG